MGIAQLLDLPEPTSEEVRRHIAASSPLRKVMEKYGVETTVDLYCFAAKTVPRGGLDWGAIWGQNAALAAQMRDGPPAKGGRPSIIEQTNKALEIIRSAEPESNSEYSAAAAAILAGQVPPC